MQRLGRVSLPSINNRELATPISRVFTPGLNRTVASYGTPLTNNIINPELMPQGVNINTDLMRLYNEESLSVEVDDTPLENTNNQESNGSTERSNIIDSNLIVSLVLNATEISGEQSTSLILSDVSDKSHEISRKDTCSTNDERKREVENKFGEYSNRINSEYKRVEKSSNKYTYINIKVDKTSSLPDLSSIGNNNLKRWVVGNNSMPLTSSLDNLNCQEHISFSQTIRTLNNFK